jgi:hypothetical protein
MNGAAEHAFDVEQFFGQLSKAMIIGVTFDRTHTIRGCIKPPYKIDDILDRYKYTVRHNEILVLQDEPCMYLNTYIPTIPIKNLFNDLVFMFKISNSLHKDFMLELINMIWANREIISIHNSIGDVTYEWYSTDGDELE